MIGWRDRDRRHPQELEQWKARELFTSATIVSSLLLKSEWRDYASTRTVPTVTPDVNASVLRLRVKVAIDTLLSPVYC